MGSGSQVLNEVRLSGSKANSLHCCYCQLPFALPCNPFSHEINNSKRTVALIPLDSEYCYIAS